MAEVGDKSFTTDMIQLIKDAVKAELGTNAFINRYLAEVTVVNSTTSEITVKLSGSDTATDGFRSRGLQLPAVGDQVVACVDGQDRWIESVIRPATSTPYLQISSGVITGISGAPTGSVVGWLTGTAPTGWLFCDGTSYAYNTYPALGALLGGTAGGNFNVPDMRDRFLGSLAAVGAWSNTSGTIGPNSTITNDRAHTHTTSHSHGFTGSSHTHTSAAHTHAVSGTTGSRTVATTTRATGSYTASWDTGHDHGNGSLAGASATPGATGSTSTGGTVASDSTATGGATYSGSSISPKATRLNFIIKT